MLNLHFKFCLYFRSFLCNYCSHVIIVNYECLYRFINSNLFSNYFVTDEDVTRTIKKCCDRFKNRVLM